MPRDISGKELGWALARLGYVPVRQRGSHMTLTTQLNGEFHVAVPMHGDIKIGTLNNILRELGRHLGLTRDELIDRLEL